MPIKLVTPGRQIKADYTTQYDERVRRIVLNTLQYVGESCITEARNNGNYIDRTGNLRSSIGYVVVNNGIIVTQGNSQKYLEGTLGETNGVKFVRDLAARNNKGMVLIVAAGMNYAVYVEARGYNVLTSAELLADSLVPQMLRAIGFTIKK